MEHHESLSGHDPSEVLQSLKKGVPKHDRKGICHPVVRARPNGDCLLAVQVEHNVFGQVNFFVPRGVPVLWASSGLRNSSKVGRLEEIFE
jgi:hypothetical protein